MKTENTLENKAKFFAQYWGQRGLVVKTKWANYNHIVDAKGLLATENSTTFFLELTPLFQITDEDAIECFKFIYGDDHVNNILNVLSETKSIFEIKLSIINSRDHLKYDFLRSKGYALPWMDLSVDDLVNYGWVKLKEK